jgi:3-deoxy-D-manno-octulosonate 8-phosphate phosphatase KdsC-like HAD superfamily phosphatase
VYSGVSKERGASCVKHATRLGEVASTGDDVRDSPALECVGLACSVADAAESVQVLGQCVKKRRGGEGVREVYGPLIAAGA